MNKSELTQIVEVVQNDNSKFDLLYQEISNKVYFWCFSFIGNEADANDLCQESIIAIYKGINSLENPEYFTTWMYKIVRSKGINYLKKIKSKDLGLIVDDDYDESFLNILENQNIEHLPKESFDLKQTKQIVLRFINNLPRRQKEVVYLHYMEELKVDEIAEVLEYNSGSVKSSLFKARQNLKLQIESYQEKNNVRLYEMSLVPLLTLVLKEYIDEVCKANKNSYNPKDFFKNTKLSTAWSQLTSVSITTVMTSVLIITSLVVVISNSYFNGNQSNSTESKKYIVMSWKKK